MSRSTTFDPTAFAGYFPEVDVSLVEDGTTPPVPYFVSGVERETLPAILVWLLHHRMTQGFIVYPPVEPIHYPLAFSFRRVETVLEWDLFLREWAYISSIVGHRYPAVEVIYIANLKDIFNRGSLCGFIHILPNLKLLGFRSSESRGSETCLEDEAEEVAEGRLSDDLVREVCHALGVEVRVSYA